MANMGRSKSFLASASVRIMAMFWLLALGGRASHLRVWARLVCLVLATALVLTVRWDRLATDVAER
jgi:hypothetical protein